MSRRPLIVPALFSSPMLLGLGGCYDAGKNFDDFVARDQKIQRDSGSVSSAECGKFTPPNCTRTPGNRKEYLITISPQPFATNPKPNLMHAVIDIDANRNMILTATNFHYDRTRLVGPPTVTDPIPIAADGSFKTDVLKLSTPPEASCATPDVANEVEVVLEGCPVCDDTEFACGVMNGRVILPVELSLDNSTFTAQLIKDPSMPPAPALDCAKTPVTKPCKEQ
jgi:hypothetical protein